MMMVGRTEARLQIILVDKMLGRKKKAKDTVQEFVITSVKCKTLASLHLLCLIMKTWVSPPTWDIFPFLNMLSLYFDPFYCRHYRPAHTCLTRLIMRTVWFAPHFLNFFFFFHIPSCNIQTQTVNPLD